MVSCLSLPRAGGVACVLLFVLYSPMQTIVGQFLDRHGRARTMGIIVFGPLMTDFLTFFVYFFSDILPGKYWLFVIAPVVEGMLGGMSSCSGFAFYDQTLIHLVPSSTMTAETSYMRDVSESHNLYVYNSGETLGKDVYLASSARNFSLLVGIFYAGSTIGPILGGFLTQQTSTVMTPFYAATAMHLAYASIAWFGMPESISKATMAHARRRYANELASVVNVDVNPFRRQIMIFTKSFWDSFPLNVLTPRRRRNSRKRDWNLTYLAISAALINAVMVRSTMCYEAFIVHQRPTGILQ